MSCFFSNLDTSSHSPLTTPFAYDSFFEMADLWCSTVNVSDLVDHEPIPFVERECSYCLPTSTP